MLHSQKSPIPSVTNISPAPDPAGRAHSASPDALAGFKGPTYLPTCLLFTHVALCQRVSQIIIYNNTYSNIFYI